MKSGPTHSAGRRSQGRWLIVSNRLPFSRNSQTKKLEPSSGGLVTAIQGISSAIPKIWLGISPDCMSPEEWKKTVDEPLRKKFVPVFVAPKDYQEYYNDFSNEVLWPLLHYETSAMNFNTGAWETYVKVNREIASVVAREYRPGDLIWIHDFHLFLVPQFLRELIPDALQGFFLHVPFPNSEVLRQLPVRAEILGGVLHANLIGFHDFSYLRHFAGCAQDILGLSPEAFEVEWRGRPVQLGVFPVSIDTAHFAEQARKPQVRTRAAQLRASVGESRIVLGVDRLDYTKGIELKLAGFREFLRTHKQWRGKVTLIQLAVPTREKVDFYKQLKQEVERLVGEINGEFGTPDYIPVRYLYSSVPFNELLALYQSAHVLLVTSKRDGMNLVCQEYIVAQNEQDPGVVVLSEFAGAISNLSHVLVVNPWSRSELAGKLAEALTMKHSQRVDAHRTMFSYLSRYTATRWAEDFMHALNDALAKPKSDARDFLEAPRKLSLDVLRALPAQKPSRVLIFMDYDGTLVPIEEAPSYAILTSDTKRALRKLLKEPLVNLVMVSGRQRSFLKEQFKDVPLQGLAAEHGAEFTDADMASWRKLSRTEKRGWYSAAVTAMNAYVSRVPGSFIEKKAYAIAWHYRQSPREFGEFQARQMVSELRSLFAELPVTIIQGKKVVEARSLEANKALFIKWYLNEYRIPEEGTLVLIIGDDATDEEAFSYFKGKAITIKVGKGFTHAAFRILDREDVLSGIETLLPFCRHA